MGWIRDAISAAQQIRTIRNMGVKDKVVIVTEEDLEIASYETAVDRKQMKLLFECIEDMAHGRSRCRLCEEYTHCKNERRGNVRGCPDWWLRFLTEDEERECRGLEPEAKESAAEGAEEDQETGVSRDDARGQDCGPDPERDHAGGSEKGMD